MAHESPLTPPVSDSDDPEYAANLRRATLASTAGSALEYFDFALYGLASALIFSKLFFSNLDPSTALIASFATFGVGFVARPLGGLFFGTVGDRLGRKWVLIATILLMGGSSTLVGALRRGIAFTSPEKSDQITRRAAKGSRGGRPPAFDPALYADRNVVERCFNRLKQFRDLATRYAKRAAYYRTELIIASIMLWLRTGLQDTA